MSQDSRVITAPASCWSTDNSDFRHNIEHSSRFQHSENCCIYRFVTRKSYRSEMFMIPQHYMMSLWYWDSVQNKTNKLVTYCAQTLTGWAEKTNRPWIVSAPPYSFMWLSNHHLTISLLAAAYRHRNIARLDHMSNLCSGNVRYWGKKYYTITKTFLCSIHKTQAHKMASNQPISKLLIKHAFEWTCRDKGSQPLGQEGTTSSGPSPLKMDHVHAIIFTCESRGEAEGERCNQWVTLHIQTSFFRLQRGPLLCPR